MDIAALSVVLSQSKVKQQASLAVMKNAMDTAKTNGNNLIHMLEKSTSPQVSHPYLGKK